MRHSWAIAYGTGSKMAQVIAAAAGNERHGYAHGFQAVDLLMAKVARNGRRARQSS
jgi:SLT domain-containing protein